MTATKHLRDLWGVWGVEETEGGRMSMISSQCDKLRERSKVLRQGRWSDGEEDARLMEDAADLILELRDDLQRANAENEKFIVKLNAEHIVRRNVEIENAKLRELVRDMVDYGEGAGNGMAEFFADRMSELGVGEDG